MAARGRVRARNAAWGTDEGERRVLGVLRVLGGATFTTLRMFTGSGSHLCLSIGGLLRHDAIYGRADGMFVLTDLGWDYIMRLKAAGRGSPWPLAKAGTRTPGPEP